MMRRVIEWLPVADRGDAAKVMRYWTDQPEPLRARTAGDLAWGIASTLAANRRWRQRPVEVEDAGRTERNLAFLKSLFRDD